MSNRGKVWPCRRTKKGAKLPERLYTPALEGRLDRAGAASAVLKASLTLSVTLNKFFRLVSCSYTRAHTAVTIRGAQLIAANTRTSVGYNQQPDER